MVAEVRANRHSLETPVADRDFRALAENLPILCWIADPDGYIFWYNPRWYEYTGTTPEQMRGWGWQSVHDPKNLGRVLELWQASISSAQPFEMVFPIRGADGIFRPFLTRINPAFDQQGRLTNWFGVNTDISPQIQAEDAFARSEAKYHVLADAMPQMVWSATPAGSHDYFNARWYEFTGVPIGATDGDRWRDMLHPEDRPHATQTWQHALQTGVPWHREIRLRHHSGQYRWVLARAQPERGRNGEIDHWYGSFTDIEELVRARNVLTRSHAELETEIIARTGERNLFATIVETTDVLVKAIDLTYNILAINKADAGEFERVFGIRARPGDNMLELLAGQPEQCQAVRAAWQRVLAGEESTVIEPHGNPALARTHYEITFRVLRNDAGEQIGAFQFATDVSQRLRDQAMLAQAQEALLQSQKLEAMGQLTGGVAHDFNNLLTPIIGSLDMLQRRGLGGLREQRLIHGARQSAERARVLVHRLLAFARRQPLQSVPTDIAALIRDVADLVASTTGPQVTVALDIDDHLPHAIADPHQLEMAILNLSVNARDAMNGAGTITISASRETIQAGQSRRLEPGSYIKLSVADTGQGMDEATRAHAVEPFFSTKGIGKGTGLGLSMAHGLASQLGGALTIRSAPGQGTEITIWLPETDRPVQRAADAPAPRAIQLQPGTVLLVDDEEYIRASTADMLSELGYAVHEAVSGEAAMLDIDAGLRPDILITDHLMPGMTGVQLAQAIREKHPETKILIVSGFADAGGIDPALPRLTKPFAHSDLAAAMADLQGEESQESASF